MCAYNSTKIISYTIAISLVQLEEKEESEGLRSIGSQKDQWITKQNQ